MKKYAWLTLMIFALCGCTEEIDIELDPTFERLVVEGHVNTDTTQHWVILTRSSDYYSGNPPQPVSGARVQLSNSSETVIMIENPVNSGLYETNPGYYGETGKTYYLEIELEEAIGGYKNYSAESMIKPVGAIDSIQVVYNDSWDAFEVKIFAWEPPTIDFYMFEILKNGILMSDTISKKWVSDDRFFNGNYTFGVTVGFLDNEKPWEAVNPGDTVTLRMSSITEDYYRFILEVQDQTFRFRNPLFSGPPANVRTNVKNAHGYFATYSITYSSTVYHGE
jgi:hypothetical protein